MKYFAVTEAVASWLLGKAGLIDSLHKVLFRDVNNEILPVGDEFIEGPFHISTSSDKSLVGMWNADYLSGTGDESWGFVRIYGELSLSRHPEISREAFERCLYVMSQRLQGLTIDGALFPRTCSNGAHTCLAGRGTEARQMSNAYFETVVGQANQKQQAIVCVGPDEHWKVLENGAQLAGSELDELVKSANALLSPSRKNRVASTESLPDIRDFLKPFTKGESRRAIGDIEVEVDDSEIDERAKFNAASLTFSDWVQGDSSLTHIQRRILLSDAVDRHPIRIVGPGGSGKTLLMQLLAVRRLRLAEDRGERIRIIYLVHNQAMAQMVRQRFDVLMNDRILTHESEATLEVKTLSQMARELLEIEDTQVIDADAHEAKLFQYEQVRKAIAGELDGLADGPSRLLSSAKDDAHIINVLTFLVMSDISVAIKGQGLTRDRRRYVQSARNLSRFHGALSEFEREFVFRVYESYHREVFESLEVLDSDDLAISLLGRIRTPIWDLRRRQHGYDYIFVDETQLFNENERRIIPLLSNGLRRHVPVVLALDEAQSIYGISSAGFATLGIEGITNESLGSIHRSTKSIVDLAFFVIQRSTDLFGADFPDFTNIAEKIEPDNHPLAARPRFEQSVDPKQDFGKFILKRVRELRKTNVRQVCVIVHADQYWDDVLTAMSASDLPLQVMLTRGQRIPGDQPIVVLTTPAYVGGQEFDAVILVGLEQGVVPPRMIDNEALSTTVEQQVFREIYLSLTRARYRVVVALSHGAAPTAVLADAAKHGLIGSRDGSS